MLEDKDAVIASMLIAEMTLYYKEQGKSLYEALIELYNRVGFFKEDLISIELQGKEGQEKIGKCLDLLRETALTEVDGVKIAKRLDYKLSKEEDLVNASEEVINLPKSNVLKYILVDGSSFVVRPSGTEPKMKVYSAVKGESLTNAEEKLKRFNEKVMEIINEKLA